MSVTSASFTIMDYTDGISLITGIDSNLPFTSQYDTTNQTLSPSWAGSTSLQLTPRVLKAGSPSDLVTSMTGVTWSRWVSDDPTWRTVVSGQNGETINQTTKVLTVNQDKLTGGNNQVQYKFAGTYRDPTLQLDFPIDIVCTFSRVMNGVSTVYARAYAPGGNQFKNSQPASLTMKAELIRGNEEDPSDLLWQWQKSTNGTVWVDLTSVAPQHTSGYTTSTLTITPDSVDSFAMFRCKITDNDSSSETYHQVFTSEGVSSYDVTDPYQAVIESTAGSYFKNNTGSTYLICRLYQNGTEIDATGATYTYTWTQTDQSGDPVPGFNPVGQAIPERGIVATNKKAISVSHTDVYIKSTFFCEVS